MNKVGCLPAAYFPPTTNSRRGDAKQASSFFVDNSTRLADFPAAENKSVNLVTFVSTKNARCRPPTSMQFSKRIILLDFLLLMLCFAVIWGGTGDESGLSSKMLATPMAKPVHGDPEEKELAAAKSSRKMSAKVLELTDPDTLPYIPFDPPM